MKTVNDIIGGSIHTMTDQIVVFMLDEQSYAIPLPVVVKVIHAIEIRPLPKAPEIITGIINVKGQIIPVADIRKRFGLVEHEIDPNDQFIIAETGKREVAILVDSVNGIRDVASGQMSEFKDTLPFGEHIRGVVKVDEGLILIYDLEQFLSLDEERELKQALKTRNNES
jgi:purine-binding chemotaxis protein CheW